MVWDQHDCFDATPDHALCSREAIPAFDYAAAPSPAIGIAPVVTLISPTVGTPLHPTDAVVFDVTDNGAFSLVAFRLRFIASGEREAVYDRDDPAGAWDPRYAGSTVTSISNGYRITLRRSGGWPGGGIGLLPRVVDAVGLVAA